MTKGNLRNKNIKLIEGLRIHNYWDNISHRKFKMHQHFSESAFGSDHDKLTEYRNIWEDPEYQKKYAAKKKKKNK
ncbi:MAG TPA: hypothetical protein VFV86_06730 [Nitrososphaeraceae archaeon]|nr:hypothetical protein [Nitrososphaeraceae archaeon]